MQRFLCCKCPSQNSNCYLVFFFFMEVDLSNPHSREAYFGVACSTCFDMDIPNLIMDSSIEGYPDYIKLLTTMDSASVPKFIFVCIWAWIFQSSFLNTGNTIVGSQGEVCLALEKTAHLCYKVAVIHPTSSEGVFLLFLTLQQLVLSYI